jgi:hypothetical protein
MPGNAATAQELYSKNVPHLHESGRGAVTAYCQG